jgi:glycosyltransferase involved in cell wall biosynthesis
MPRRPRHHRPTILHVLHTFRAGGAEVLVRDLVAAHADRFDHAIIALDEDGPLRESFHQLGAHTYLLDRKPGLDHRCATALRRIAHQHHDAIIHAHQYTPFFYTALAQFTAGLDARIIFTEHGRHFPDRTRLPRRVINRLVLHRMADRITAVGHFIKQALIDHDGIPADRIEVIHNGIDPARFAAPPAGFDRDRLRASIGADAGTRMILHVAGFRPVKDHATALQSLKWLHALGCPATLVFAGSGPTMPQIQAEADALRLADRVKFLGNRTDIAALWHASDVGLLTSLSEGVSVAILEAGAAGKPVVATNVGGNSEIILDGLTGKLAPRGDAAALAAALKDLLIDADQRARLGRAAAQRVCSHFTQQQMHAAYTQIYHDLLADQAEGRHVA